MDGCVPAVASHIKTQWPAKPTFSPWAASHRPYVETTTGACREAFRSRGKFIELGADSLGNAETSERTARCAHGSYEALHAAL
eukprot:13432436-Alexandrium_andersonii.AAC.1